MLPEARTLCARPLSAPDNRHCTRFAANWLSCGLVQGEEGREGRAGKGENEKAKAKAVRGVPADDQYDYDDQFIDDSELIDYYGGDNRKSKYSGFYINQVSRAHSMQRVLDCAAY